MEKNCFQEIAMKTHQTQKDFEYPSYDFDFDFDLRLTAFDYLLLALYAVFVFPFVFLNVIVIKPVQEYIRKRKEVSKDVNLTLGFKSTVPLGPCCSWPRVTNRY